MIRRDKDVPGQEELDLTAATQSGSTAEAAVPVASHGDAAPPAEPPGGGPGGEGGGSNDGSPLAEQFKSWFLDYSSYVILDRAVPHMDDGLKPVQRRILETMYRMDDGRYHKVANIVGEAMKLHPHGDMSIKDALVSLGQKGLLIDTQGNFGNPLTGDEAAASRYIEARLTKFALDVAFNPKTTIYQASYDGRSKEPVTLPVKFPLLLAQGAEGIAVGLSTKILPHNFNDLINASINHLQGKRFRLLPDFPTGGIADFSEYNDGQRGGRVKVRARIEQRSKYVFAITEIPWGTTTTGLMDSIRSATEKGKVKVKKIEDLTAAKVEIVIELSQTADPEKTIQQLFVFTDCEMSHSPIACVIDEGKPRFVGVSDILRRCTDRTLALLKQELEIRLRELEDQWHFESLERIFIEERIYRRIEKAETWEAVLAEIRTGLKPFASKLRRPITDDDLVRLTEIKIKRISRYDAKRADEQILALEKEMKQVKHDLAHPVEYTVAWFERLREKYGKGLKRRTEHDEIGEISKSEVVASNRKLYLNLEEGFIGFSLKGAELLCECSELDDVIAFMEDGTMKVSKVGDKVFIGNGIRHISLFSRGDDTTVYHLIYKDAKTGATLAKRFQVGGVVRDKVYNLCKSEGSKVLYLSAHKAAGPEKVKVVLNPRCSARNKELEWDFGSMEVRGRDAVGNLVTKYPVQRVVRQSS
jgi:topoisomerase-4 subunit A